MCACARVCTYDYHIAASLKTCVCVCCTHILNYLIIIFNFIHCIKYFPRTAEQLSAETDDTSARMRRAMAQVNELLDKQSEGCNWTIIGVLAGLLFVLIILVFYM